MVANNTSNDPSGLPATFTIMIAVGPGPEELVRIRDLLSALVHYEPTVSRVILVDDSSAPEQLKASLPPLPVTCSVQIVISKRAGRGAPRLGGGSVVMLTGIEAVSRGDVGEFLLKLDTDALIVGPFSEKIRGVMQRERDVGIIGACTISPLGKPRGAEHHQRIFSNAGTWRLSGKERKSVGRHYSFPTNLTQFRLYRIIRRAKNAGCTLGENVSGGAYVVTAEAIRRMTAAGLLSDVLLWLDTFATEDAIIPLYAKMLGLRLIDFVGTNEVFGVVYRGLPASLPQIVKLGYSIIHSIKNDERVTEDEVRTFFAERRQAELASG